MHYEKSAHCVPGAQRVHSRTSGGSPCASGTIMLTSFQATSQATEIKTLSRRSTGLIGTAVDHHRGGGLERQASTTSCRREHSLVPANHVHEFADVRFSSKLHPGFLKDRTEFLHKGAHVVRGVPHV
jgi:hypothetical protein